VNRRSSPISLGIGCLIVLILIAIPIGIAIFAFDLAIPITGPTPTSPIFEGPRDELEEPTFIEPNNAGPIVDIPPFTELYERVNPGVVNIRIIARSGSLQPGDQFQVGVGSGFILSEEGYIVTNHHVVAEGQQFIVAFHNGIEQPAVIIGTDPDSDLAIIKVDVLEEGAVPLPLGDSDQVLPGERVVALGNPLGLGSSMTAGVVSQVGRIIPSGAEQFSIPQAIQTDADIFPGNSGGPLVNMAGEVIGINALIRLAGQADVPVGVGLSIPVNILKMIAPDLIERGEYQWPWLGVSGGGVNYQIMIANDLETQHGAYIDDVVANSPAGRAGLQGSSQVVEVEGMPAPVGGDVIVEIDGIEILDFAQLLAEITSRQPGDVVNLGIIRDGQRVEFDVQLEPRPRGANE
jgi:S1-C subfamily serine protease